MATQATEAQEVKIFSSNRPLQIQRSFEGSSEVLESLGSPTHEVSIEKRSTVTITTHTSASSTMSIVQSAVDGTVRIPASPSAAPSTVIVKTGSSTSAAAAAPASPGAVIIRSSAAAAGDASPHPQVGSGAQSVTVIKSAAAASSQVPVQSHVIIKSAQVVGTQHVIQQSSPNRIVINPTPIAQSRITIGGGGGAHVVQDGAEINRNDAQSPVSPVVSPALVSARRSSLTIKTAPSPAAATPTTETPIANSTPSVQLASAPPQPPAVDSSPVAQEVIQPDHHHSPQPPAAAAHHAESPEHKPSEPDLHPAPPAPAPAPTPVDLSERVREKKPAGLSVEELLEKINISYVFFVALAVLLAAVGCILGEGEVPLSWILAAVAFLSLVSFITLRI